MFQRALTGKKENSMSECISLKVSFYKLYIYIYMAFFSMGGSHKVWKNVKTAQRNSILLDSKNKYFPR